MSMYAQGWDERTEGNISLLQDEAEARDYLDANEVRRTIPTGFEASALDDRHRQEFQEHAVCARGLPGPVCLTDNGTEAQLLWGLHRLEQIHLRVSDPHDKPGGPPLCGLRELCYYALPSGEPPDQDLCSRAGRAGLYPGGPLADAHGVHRGLSGRHQRAALDALWHQLDRRGYGLCLRLLIKSYILFRVCTLQSEPFKILPPTGRR